MNKLKIKLFFLTSALFISGNFSVDFVQAKSNISELGLEITQFCNIKSAGDSCVAEFKIINNTEKVLSGEASLYVGYQGVCGSSSFDGEGIEARFSIMDKNWINFSGWIDGITTVSDFRISKGETQSKLNIKTHPALCPGTYTFNLGLRGEEYVAPPIAMGGSSYIPSNSTLSAEVQKVDANKDNKIDILDFNILMINWGKTEPGNIADFNGDGVVDIFDFNLLMINWTI